MTVKSKSTSQLIMLPWLLSDPLTLTIWRSLTDEKHSHGSHYEPEQDYSLQKNKMALHHVTVAPWGCMVSRTVLTSPTGRTWNYVHNKIIKHYVLLKVWQPYLLLNELVKKQGVVALSGWSFCKIHPAWSGKRPILIQTVQSTKRGKVSQVSWNRIVEQVIRYDWLRW